MFENWFFVDSSSVLSKHPNVQLKGWNDFSCRVSNFQNIGRIFWTKKCANETFLPMAHKINDLSESLLYVSFSNIICFAAEFSLQRLLFFEFNWISKVVSRDAEWHYDRFIKWALCCENFLEWFCEIKKFEWHDTILIELYYHSETVIIVLLKWVLKQKF